MQADEVVEAFNVALEQHGLNLREEIVTYAEQLLAEGHAKGHAEGQTEGRNQGEIHKQVEVANNLVQIGMTWDVIEAATGLDKPTFEDLKTRLPY